MLHSPLVVEADAVYLLSIKGHMSVTNQGRLITDKTQSGVNVYVIVSKILRFWPPMLKHNFSKKEGEQCFQISQFDGLQSLYYGLAKIMHFLVSLLKFK